MNEKDLLAAIGISESVLAYFETALGTVTSESLFFRVRQECPIPVISHVLSSNNSCWTFGQKNPALVSRVIVSPSPLEAISWLSCHHKNCADLDQLLFVAAGNVPGQGFYDLMSETYRYKKLSLVLGADLLGRICDIRLVTRLKGKDCNIKYLNDGQVLIVYQGREIVFEEDKLSLNSFETATGIRSGIRTYKSKKHNTFYEQLAENARIWL